MKRTIIFVSFSIIFVVILLISRDLHADKKPKPTEIIFQNDEEENNKAREEWIEQIHRTAPGVDWREIDRAARNELRITRLKSDKNISSGDIEEIAGGILTGRWIEKGSYNLAGRMHNIDVDVENDRIYGVSDGGQVWVGGMNGENWTSLSDHYQVKGVHYFSILKKPDGSDRIVQANTRPNLLYSDDEGKIWFNAKGLDAMSSANLVRGVNTADGEVYLLFTKSGSLNYLYRSSDLGSSFTLLDTHTGTDKSDIWTSRYEPSRVFFIDKENLFSINDGGELEELSGVGINFSSDEINRVQLNGMVKNDTVHLFTMYRLQNSTKFFSSGDGGKTWRIKGELTEGPFMRNSFGVSTLNPNVMGFGGVNSFRSEDGGSSWTMINSWGEYYGDVATKLHADIPEIEFIRISDDKELAFISTDGGSYYSDDNLRTVKNISLSDLRVSQYYTTYTHRQKTQIIYAGAQDQGFQRSTEITEGVATFEQTISGDYGHIVSSDGGRSLWTVYPGFAMYYPNAATSNNEVMWSFTGEKHFWMPPLMADPYFPDRVYLAGGTSTDGSHLWYLEDKGGSIAATEHQYDFSGGNGAWISAMAFSPVNKDYRYVLNSKGKLFYSSDRGISWTKSLSTGPGSHYFYGNSIIPDPKDINTIYIGGSGYSGSAFWVSKDGGSRFRPKTKGLPRTLIFELAGNEDCSLIFAATELGPFVYIVSEERWYDLAGGSAPEQTYWSVDYVPALKTARFGTYGRGIWDFKISNFTGINEDQLWVNSIGVNVYPNPVVDVATIEYSLDIGSRVQINLWDNSGRLVKRLDDNFKLQGRHQFHFNMNEMASGLYFLRLRSGKLHAAKKLLKK